MIRVSLRFAMVALAALPAAVAWGQAFNLDLDLPVSPELGGGTPSSSFGAAAGQAGYWQGLGAAGFFPTPLRGLDGNLTNVVCTSQSTVGGGFNFPANTGDFALLLNDCTATDASWTIQGLSAGAYEILVYAAKPWPGDYNPTPITITSDSGGMTLVVTGPMPGNAFALGITHQVFDISTTDGSLNIVVGSGQFHGGWVNGFQIVPVPEPASFLPLLGGFCLLRRRRYKRRAA